MEEKPTEKQCHICGETKPLSEFHKHDQCKFGVDNRCKECKKRKVKGMGTYPETPEIITGNIIFETTAPTEHARGPKETNGKPDWAVFPFREAEAVVKVFEYGANKYGAPFTYRKGIPSGELWSAIMRHMIEIQNGNDIDAESGCLHTAHIAANAMMMLSGCSR
jgi:hypothetical protein